MKLAALMGFTIGVLLFFALRTEVGHAFAETLHALWGAR